MSMIKLTRSNGTTFIKNVALIADVSVPSKPDPRYLETQSILTYTTVNERMGRQEFDFVNESPEEIWEMMNL